MTRTGYQMARLTREQRDRRDKLVQQIVNGLATLYGERLIRMADLEMEQDEVLGARIDGAHVARADSPGFYAEHKKGDYRLNVILVVRAKDRS